MLRIREVIYVVVKNVYEMKLNPRRGVTELNCFFKRETIEEFDKRAPQCQTENSIASHVLKIKES